MIVGMPDSILKELIDSLADQSVMDAFMEILKTEIDVTQQAIALCRGVGIYQNDCKQWSIHLEVYTRMSDILSQLTKEKRSMTYKKVVENITHWHEHEIHDRISAILGYDTWKIGTAFYVDIDTINLLLEFPSREDYERCVAAIVEVCGTVPPDDEI